LSIPYTESNDWHLVKEDVGDLVYRSTSVNGSVALSEEVHIQNDVKTNPYGALNRSPRRPIPVSMQAPGLQTASIYCNLEDWGLAMDTSQSEDAMAVIPLKMTMTVSVPIGCSITTSQLQDHAAKLIAQFSDVENGDVVPFGKVAIMAGGGIRI
jgi:hypothetical protein